jgi:hypothetical protein
MSDGSPFAVCCADLHADPDRILAGGILQVPPTNRFSPGCFMGLVMVVQYGVEIALAIHQPIDPLHKQVRQ